MQVQTAPELLNLPSFSFYNDEVTIYYDDVPHAYMRMRDDGTYGEIKGVTTVVHVIDKSQALTPWAAKMTKECALTKLEPGVAYTADELKLILEDAAKHFREYTEQAADLGKAAHNCLEDSIKWGMKHTNGVVLELVALPYTGQQIGEARLTPDQATKATNCAQRGHKWMKDHNVRWLYTERKIYSRMFDYAGTMDGLALVDACGDPQCCFDIVDGRRVAATFKDILSLIDWKSSNYLYDEYRFQTASYQHAHQEEFDVEIQMRWVLRLGKTEGDFEYWRIPAEDFGQDFQAFLECLDLCRSLDDITYRERDRKAAARDADKAEREEVKQAEKDAKQAERDSKKAERDEKKAIEEQAKAERRVEREEAKAARDAEKLRKSMEKAAAKASAAPARLKQRRTKKNKIAPVPVGELPEEATA